MLTRSFTMLNAAVLTSNITSNVLDMRGYDVAGFHVTTTGAPDHAGTLYFQQTNTEASRVPVTPVSMSVPTLAIVSGTNTSKFIEITDVASGYLNLFYNRTSGGAADTITVTAVGKSRGVIS